MSRRDDFTLRTKRILAERAGQRCSNLDCGRSTSGPSDDASGGSTRLGKASHITAAASGGPRYDATLTPEERSAAENGIWLCCECADRVDKPENATQFPVELLRHWKQFGESITGTDHASKSARSSLPLRRLTVNDFAGVRGNVSVPLGALNIFLGTSRLSHSVCELVRLLSSRDAFQRARQPRSGVSSWTHATLPLDEDRHIVMRVTTNEPRHHTSRGRVTAEMSDGRSVSVVLTRSGATLHVDGAAVPAFSPAFGVICTSDETTVAAIRSALREAPDTLAAFAGRFKISPDELRACLTGTPTDESLFGYSYELSAEHGVHVDSIDGVAGPTRSVGTLSNGELERVVLDVLSRLAKYAATFQPTVLAINQSHLTALDQRGWAVLLEWADKKVRNFQVVVDRLYPPSEGNLSHAMCYVIEDPDMQVSSFRQVTWADFRR